MATQSPTVNRKKRVLISGASGLLGSAMVECFDRNKDQWEVFTIGRQKDSLKNRNCNITEEKEARDLISSLKPEVFVHWYDLIQYNFVWMSCLHVQWYNLNENKFVWMSWLYFQSLFWREYTLYTAVWKCASWPNIMRLLKLRWNCCLLLNCILASTSCKNNPFRLDFSLNGNLYWPEFTFDHLVVKCNLSAASKVAKETWRYTVAEY